MNKKEADFYQKLRKRMQKWLKSKKGASHKWADYLLFAPDLFHLLCKLSIDSEVPAKEKAKLIAAIVYFISPLDLMPEAILGPVGYLDDIVVAAMSLDSVINNTNTDVVKRHWAGDEDVLKLIKHILQVSNQMIGIGLLRKIGKLFGFSK